MKKYYRRLCLVIIILLTAFPYHQLKLIPTVFAGIETELNPISRQLTIADLNQLPIIQHMADCINKEQFIGTFLGHSEAIRYEIHTENVVGDRISGDIIISLDRVGENATLFGGDFDQELRRVIIHGVLHLLGNKDKTDEEAMNMRKLENDALSMFVVK